MSKIRAAIIGATGYTGAELIRILVNHPNVELQHFTSESSAGKSVASMHAGLAARVCPEWKFEKCDVKTIAKDSDLVFLCLPHAQSAAMAKEFFSAGIAVIDLSADLRLKDVTTYEKWYKVTHPCPELLQQAVYGLPEIYREKIKTSRLIANPGCYVTTAILSLLPLLKNKLIDAQSIIIDAKSGTSGAGKKAEARYLFCETQDNFLAYGVAQHRHAPEIEQELALAAELPALSTTFVPHLLPINRGILATCYAQPKQKIDSTTLQQLYAEFYVNEPFVHVLTNGSFPELKTIQNNNHCFIGVRVDERNGRIIVVGALDNLCKGASGQAVQNMNLMFNFGETCGLDTL